MQKSTLVICYLTILLVLPALAANEDALQVGFTMEARKSDVDNSSVLFEKAVFYFNSDQVQDIQMRPDLSSPVVMMGLMPSNDWGVVCGNDTNKTHCTQTAAATTVSYLGKSYSAYQLNIPSPFKRDNSYSLNNDYLTAYGLFAPLESGKDKFVLGSTGVLGLAPQSPYFSNLFKHYKYANDTFTFSFEYNPDKNQAWWKETEGNAYRSGLLTLNGYSTKDVASGSKLQNVSVPQASAWWQLPDVELFLGNTSLASKKVVCITNARNSIFASDASIDLLKKINQQLCGKDTACEASADKSKVMKIVLKVNGFELEIQPTDFLYTAEKNTMGLAIDNIADWKAQKLCSEESSLALGRLFFAKYSVVFRRSSKGDHTLGFAIKKQARLLSATERFMFVSIGLGMIAITTIIMVFKLFYDRCKKPSPDYNTV